MNKTCTKRPVAVLLSLLRGVVCLLMLLSFIVAILSFSFKQVIADRQNYRLAAQAPTLAQELIDHVRDDLETECLFYGLPLDIVDEAVSREMAADYIVQYVDAVYDAVFVSGKLTVPTLDAASFRAPIAQQLEAEEVDDAVIDALADEFAAVTAASWRMGLDQKLLSPMHKVMVNPWVVRFLNAGPLLVGVTALLFAAGLLLGMRRIRRQVFSQLGVLTVGSMLLFVPLWLLDDYHLAQKLVLGDSPLRTFFIHLTETFTAQLYSLSLWVMVACCALTVLAVVWVVWPAKQDAAETTEVISADQSAEEPSPIE